MEIIGLGAALGMLIAAACVMCYRKGVRDGMAAGKGECPSRLSATAPAPGSPKSAAFWGGKQGGLSGDRKGFGNGKPAAGDDEAAMMMRRYEAILSYDPYNQKAAMSEGERI